MSLSRANSRFSCRYLRCHSRLASVFAAYDSLWYPFIFSLFEWLYLWLLILSRARTRSRFLILDFLDDSRRFSGSAYGNLLLHLLRGVSALVFAVGWLHRLLGVFDRLLLLGLVFGFSEKLLAVATGCKISTLIERRPC